ncbi:MAG TPA: HEAT repeat domain-containing protein [Candidatus Omnitrophota bacterium]|nr:HEAT repeat domain-containing protein [Candidatus Omnitrophota bacterium]HPD84747.1 HEAT repeat domain-containing protein [Candidatus Omnitrophota bacterium]HRZ03605.1 HEAT repeat domain-containing protein [Candidatus Omnitrophota bacterium]
MYNYFTDLVWKVDVGLFFLALALVLGIPYYGGVKFYFESRRIKKLRAIKENVYRLALNKETASPQQQASFIRNISPQIFLDVAANRVREEVFFNEAEQSIFKQHYIEQANIRKLESVAARSFNKWRRIEAILALGYAGASTSLETLKKSLFEKDEDISYFSALALGQMRNPDSARLLLEFLRKNSAHRYKIASLLGQFPPAVSSEVILLTQDNDYSVRFFALQILASFKDSSHIERLEELTRDESAEVRGAACECLGVAGDRSALATLKGCLKDRVWFVKMQAVGALENLLGDECVGAVIELISDNSWLVIDGVKKVLAKHIENALPYLENFLAGEDPLSRNIAVEIIESSGYIEKLYTDLLAGGATRGKALDLLKRMVKAGAYNGLDPALYSLDKGQYREILGSLREIDETVARRIEENLKGKDHS